MIKKNISVLMLAFFAVLLPELSPAGEVDLPKTGQTTCYDSSGNVIDCTNTGQDGDIQAGVEWPKPRFEDNGDGTVTDHLTGLIWLKNGNCGGIMAWENALSYCNNLANGSCGLTDDSIVGDWRLPNIVELESLVNAEKSSSGAWLNTQGFTSVQSSYYWSATTCTYNTGYADYAWDVNMGSGYVELNNKSLSLYVWPVRAGQTGPAETWKTGQENCYNASGSVIDCTDTGQDGDIRAGVEWPVPRFEDNENGTVTDHLTGLIWLKKANCFGQRSWPQALTDSINLADGLCGLSDGSVPGDWHLPNRKELLSLIDYSQYSPPLPQDHLFNNVHWSWYWSATTRANNTRYAWYVRMIAGCVGSLHKSNQPYVWPVRSGQGGPFADLIIDNVLCIPNSIIPGNNTTIKIQVNNRGDSKETTFIASKIIDPTGNEIDLEIKSHQLDADDTITFDYPYTVPLDAELGQYDINAQLYENCSGTCTNPIGSPYLKENAFEVSSAADITPPSPINDLTADTGLNRGEIEFSWTASGDDGTTGSASDYILKYATVPINENNWNSADTYTQTWTPEPSGTMESKTVTGFSPGQEFYFALKATDDVLNESAVSNSVSALSSSAEGANSEDVNGYRIIADNITYLNATEFEATGNVSLNEVLFFTGLVHVNLTTLVITGDGDVFIPDVPMMGDVLLYKGGFEFDLINLIKSGLESISQVAGIDLEIEEMEFLLKDLQPDGVKVTAKVKLPHYLASGEIEVNQLEISRTHGISGSIDIPEDKFIQINGCKWKLMKSENYPTDPLMKFDSETGLFKGRARIILTKFELEASISFIDGQLYGIGICYGFPEPGKAILIIPPPTGPLPVVFLQEICGGVENIPNPKALILSATADITAGPEIQDYYLVGLDNAGLELDISSRATLSGTLVLGGSYDLAYAEAFIDWHDEVFGANGEMNALNIFTAQANFLIDRELNIAGRAEGNLYIPDEWYYWPLRGKEVANVLGLLDNDGIKGQVEIAGQDWLSAAFGFDWEGNFDVARNIESLSTEEISGKKLLLRSIDGELLPIDIPAGSEVIYIRVRWTGEGTSSVELIRPDASRITPDDCDTDPDIYCESGTKEFWYALHNPVAGQWQVDIIDPADLGEITLEVLSGNGKPYIQLTAPSSDTSTSTTLKIDWIDSDADDNAAISLWYDTDPEGYDGSIIIDGLNEDDTVDTYTWDVTSIPTGEYYVYAQIDDGKNAPVRSYAAGKVTINNPLYPATPTNLQATITEKLMELTWDEVTGCTYTLYYTEETSRDIYENYFSLTEDNHWIVNGSLGGKEIKFGVQAVDSELRASLISSPITVTVPNRSAIKVEPSTIDFGDVSHVGSYKAPVLICNSGTEDLMITALKFDGADKNAFDITKDCPLTISPGASQEVEVRLSPNKKGAYAAIFQVVSDDPSGVIAEVGLTATVNYLCECDFSSDGSCNILDWPYFIEDWGRNDCNDPGVNCECDLNGDGSCNIMDWPYFIEDWGRTDCPTP